MKEKEIRLSVDKLINRRCIDGNWRRGVDFSIVCFLRKGPKERNLPASATAEDVMAQKEYVSEGKKLC